MKNQISEILTAARTTAEFLGISVEQALRMASSGPVTHVEIPADMLPPALVAGGGRRVTREESDSDRMSDEEFLRYKFVDNVVEFVRHGLSRRHAPVASFKEVTRLARRPRRQLREPHVQRAITLLMAQLELHPAFKVDYEQQTVTLVG